MDPEQVKMLRETHSSVISIKATLNERCKVHQRRMDSIEESVDGNGRTGLKTDVAIMKKWFAAIWFICGSIVLAVCGLIYERVTDCLVNH